jgi:hypothetical protein
VRGGRIGGIAFEPLVDPRRHARQHRRVGREQAVHLLLVGGPELRIAVIAVPERRHRLVIGDVARALLEVARQPRPFEHLRHDVRHVLAGDMRAAELSHRVVAVADEHPVEQR